MTRIEFYILSGTEAADRIAYIEKLTLQMLGRGKTVHIHTSCASETRQMIRVFQHLEEADHITIDHKGEPEDNTQVLFNLAADVPHFFSRFDTTYEVVHENNQSKVLGRERYRYYQERGYPLFYKEIEPELSLVSG